MIGQTLGHYRIESKLGEGGMGVVYRARDLHLDRPVAIKVLPSEKVADLERKRRFVQEAKAASALNHPNILHIYDIDSAHGVDFIAMEFVDGKTLDELIGRKGLRLGEVLNCSVQIAEGLAAAHAAGIIHRDVKPGNIMVTEKGLVKVLDFGLAKLIEQTQDDPSAPTETRRQRTGEGVVVGTVAYMSPEQAEGKKVDARSDIFSFGSVLYEMVTGRRPFDGQSSVSTLSAILHKDPAPVTQLVPAAPAELEKTVSRCLRKDPERRIQHMDDVKLALQELKEESESGKLPVSARSRRGALLPLMIVAGVALVAATVILTWRLAAARRPMSVPALTRLTSDAGLTAYSALSADGKLLAYASDRASSGNLDIWVQQVGGGAPIRLTHNDADDVEPSFSPDGTRVVFRSERDGGGVYMIASLGGLEQRIADRGRNPRYSPDGKWIAYWVGDLTFFGPHHLYVIASGVTSDPGQPREPQPNFFSASYPVWSPDSTHILFLGANDANVPRAELYDWWTTPLDGGDAVRSGVSKAFQQQGLNPLQQPWDWVGSSIFFSAEFGGAAGLWKVPVSLRNWRVDGPPERLTSGTSFDVQPSAAAGSGGQTLLAFASQSQNFELWSLAIDARTGKTSGDPQRLTSGPAADHHPVPSADSKTLAFSSDRFGNFDIFVKDLDSGTETPVAVSPATKFPAAISPDGSRLAYATFDFGKAAYTGYYVVPLRGGVSQRFCDTCAGAIQDWSVDGRKILYRTGLTTETQLVLRDVQSGKETPFLNNPPYNVTAARFSPDGQWLSFQTVISSTRRRIFITPVRNEVAAGEQEWIPVTDGSGLDRNAVWSPDGQLLFFVSDRDGFRCFWAQRLDPATKRPIGSTFEVYSFHRARRSLIPVGEMAIINLSVTSNRIFFSMPEQTGNIWMAKLEEQN